MSNWDSSLLAVEVESAGVRCLFGPIAGLPDAMSFVSEHVSDVDVYRHGYVRLFPPSEAAKLLPQRGDATPMEGLFELPPREKREPLEVALRDAIAVELGEPGAGARGDGLYSHLDVHRPWRVRIKDQECWDEECGHPRDPDGGCAAPGRVGLWCRACTPLYRAGGEYDGIPYHECQVDWPCSPVLALCASFNVSLTGKALPTERPE